MFPLLPSERFRHRHGVKHPLLLPDFSLRTPRCSLRAIRDALYTVEYICRMIAKVLIVYTYIFCPNHSSLDLGIGDGRQLTHFNRVMAAGTLDAILLKHQLRHFRVRLNHNPSEVGSIDVDFGLEAPST